MKHVTDGNFIFQPHGALMLITFNTFQLLQCETSILSFWLATPQKWSRV